MPPPRRITDLDRRDFRAVAESLGLQSFRGDQAYRWVMERGVRDPARMSNLPAAFRDELAKRFDVSEPDMTWQGDDASTTDKLFLRLEGGDGVEAVLIMEGERTTACLSTQLGCPVACQFCASGLLGLKRNLTRGEILDQFLEVRRRAAEKGRRVSNIVMMGMGEPMLNYAAVIGALEIINDPWGGGIGARHITISTIGLAKGVERLATEGKQYTLAFSLHAPDDELRARLIPFPGRMSIDEMVQAARHYLEDTGREVTFEYVLLDGVNASPAQARQLARTLQGVRGTVNLIPYNENPGLDFRRPSPEAVDAFAGILRHAGIKVSVRKRKGHRILAACGQLRLRHAQDEKGGAPRAEG
jgi:23S rRNA (adenine2503-C2)-methyltransferase